MKNVGNLTITTPTDREIAITRVFDAPRRRVFEAYTRPEQVKRWLGAFGVWTLAVCEVDLREGGGYRYEWHGPEGARMGVSGAYREVVPPERIVSTERFDDPWYEGEGHVTVAFVEQGGKTTLTTTLRYVSQAVRDGVLKSPMEHGMDASYNKLAEVLAAA